MEAQAGRVRALRCAACGDVIGVYEPLVHVVDGIAHRTSRAADPQLALSPPDACYHLACCEAGGEQLMSIG